MLVGPHDVEVRDLLGLVRQRFVLPDQVDDVGTKSVHAAVEPEPQHVVHRFDDLLVSPVQVGLVRQEEMQVPLRGRFVPRPGRPPERRPPVVRGPVAPTVTPHIPASFRRIPRRARLAEPGMLRARVVGHPVEDQPQSSSMRLGEQAIEPFEIAEDRVDGRVVAHVISEVGHRRAVDRRQPDPIDTERGHVVEPRADAGEVADTVAAGVRERARIDLVDNGRPPPRLTHPSFAPSRFVSHPAPLGPS